MRIQLLSLSYQPYRNTTIPKQHIVEQSKAAIRCLHSARSILTLSQPEYPLRRTAEYGLSIRIRTLCQRIYGELQRISIALTAADRRIVAAPHDALGTEFRHGALKQRHACRVERERARQRGVCGCRFRPGRVSSWTRLRSALGRIPSRTWTAWWAVPTPSCRPDAR